MAGLSAAALRFRCMVLGGGARRWQGRETRWRRGQQAAVTADLPAGLTTAKPPAPARAPGEPRIPRPGRVLAVATAVCAAMWLVAFSLPVSGPDHDSSAGAGLAVTATFCYVMVLLTVGTPILADWLNKHW